MQSETQHKLHKQFQSKTRHKLHNQSIKATDTRQTNHHPIHEQSNKTKIYLRPNIY